MCNSFFTNERENQNQLPHVVANYHKCITSNSDWYTELSVCLGILLVRVTDLVL